MAKKRFDIEVSGTRGSSRYSHIYSMIMKETLAEAKKDVTERFKKANPGFINIKVVNKTKK
ncbi:MAG: hypothetical protein IJ489_05750 [Clostridia bacterium]|nr:hypothetical protein [Clostridia bacterium]